MDLKLLRDEITLIDQELVALFMKRMHVAAQIVNYKKEHHLPVCDPAREQAVLSMVAEQAESEMSDYVKTLYCTLIELSRDYQSTLY